LTHNHQIGGFDSSRAVIDDGGEGNQQWCLVVINFLRRKSEVEKVTVLAYAEVKAGLEEQFLAEIPALVAATRAEAACLNYDFHRAVDEPNKFMFYENWTSLAGLQEHARSEHIQRFRAKIAGLLARPIEIKLYQMVTEPA
jgi:quinol monooxygenase YgiN